MSDPLWWLFQGYAIAVGLVFGSFWNVCIERWPQDRSVLSPRSHCDVCGHTLRARDLVPVASYVALRGRCRDCGARIPPATPLVELLGGLLAWLAFRRFVPDGVHLDVAHGLAATVFFGFLGLLVVEAYVDLRHRIIPDETSIYAAPFGVVAHAALGVAGYQGWLDLDWKAALLGAAVGGGFLATAALVSMLVLRREGLGWGDVKLVAMIGAFLGPFPGAVFVVLIGSLLGSIAALVHLAVTRGRSYVPVGPALALASALYVLWGDDVLRALLPPGVRVLWD